MMLVIDLPPVPRELDVNNGKRDGRARAGAVKMARGQARGLALRAMQKAGVKRGEFHPRFVYLVTFWRGHRVDYDNRLANVKAFQDGIFDMLGADDNEVCTGCSSVVHLDKEHARFHLSMRLMLFDDWEEFLQVISQLSE